MKFIFLLILFLCFGCAAKKQTLRMETYDVGVAVLQSKDSLHRQSAGLWGTDLQIRVYEKIVEKDSSGHPTRETARLYRIERKDSMFSQAETSYMGESRHSISTEKKQVSAVKNKKQPLSLTLIFIFFGGSMGIYIGIRWLKNHLF